MRFGSCCRRCRTCKYAFQVVSLWQVLHSASCRAADFIADVILVALPIRLLWNLKLSPPRRALLTGIFSASMFTTAVSIVHGVYVFSSNRNAEGIWAHILVRFPLVFTRHHYRNHVCRLQPR